MSKKYISTSGNQAAARMAYAMTEVAAIFPITPSSDMAEYYDSLTTKGTKNAFGITPKVIEMQSEAGAAGTLHGALAGGALATTFTASQGLLLMIPNMYKIAGELLPCVMHVSARTIATHALSIFGDHSDVMATRSTGFAMLASSNVQEAQDMALIAHLASLKSSYPYLHFFDGFRTSHEINKIEAIDDATVSALCKEIEIEKDIAKFRSRALDPTNPHQAGTAQNPDTYFQNREACNQHIGSIYDILHNILGSFAKTTGRTYEPFEYYGDPKAEHIIIAMGSGTDTIQEYINNQKGLGLLRVRLYRPFDIKNFLNKIPATCKTITVLDRTKENGAIGDPLYLDVCGAYFNNTQPTKPPHILGGRYGLSSKEFTPSMVHAVFENAKSKEPKNHFTIGIEDDVTNTSLYYHEAPTQNRDITECLFYGLGSDGTVSANKNSATIISNETDLYAQAYFVYDSKKSGGTTVSHLRFSKDKINMPYLVHSPTFVACHNQTFLTKFDMLSGIQNGGTFLLNTTYDPAELMDILPPAVKAVLMAHKINFYTINAYKIAADLGLGGRINTIMQSAFFYLTKIIDYETAKKLMRAAAEKSYGSKGQKVLDMNYAAIDSAEANLQKLDIAAMSGAGDSCTHDCSTCTGCGVNIIEESAEQSYYEDFCGVINAMQGDSLPVSAFSPDGFVPTATTQFEKRNLATMLPEWKPENCIQCNFCSLVCPHATIRPHIIDKDTKAPETFKSLPATGFPDKQYRIQVNPHDCTGCGSCANVCPAKNKALVMKDFDTVNETDNYNFSAKLPDTQIEANNVKNSQFRKPYFEFSGACAGCGETPYIKLVSQLFGERMIIANATGCTSIYGGSSPTCPYTKDDKGRGPAWANSLFEDNAEFGYGIKLAQDIRGKVDSSVWIIGGDGWAYDIGYGGLDHVCAQNLDVNILILDTQVYSNTGGQSSKSTPAGAVAKFASGGKETQRKDLGAMLMNYDNCYVAQIALGANYVQAFNAIKEAESHKGPSVIIAYATCINHGIDMSNGMQTMKNAVDSGYWILYRRRPANSGKPAEFLLDSPEPKAPYKDFIGNENRYKALIKNNPETAAKLAETAEANAKQTYSKYKKLTQQ